MAIASGTAQKGRYNPVRDKGRLNRTKSTSLPWTSFYLGCSKEVKPAVREGLQPLSSSFQEMLLQTQRALSQLIPDPVKSTRKINITNYHVNQGICCFTWKITQVYTRSSNTILYNIRMILYLESYQCVQMLQKPESLRELCNCFNLLEDILFTYYLKCTYYKLDIVLLYMGKKENIVYCR